MNADTLSICTATSWSFRNRYLWYREISNIYYY